MQIHRTEDGKDLLTVRVSAGLETPYYYAADGVTEAYVRIGNESVIASPTELKRLVLRGKNSSYDSLVSTYAYEDYAFSKLRERYKAWTGNSMTEKNFESFEIKDRSGNLTNAGALLADECPIRWSRLFCTRWNGLDKSSGLVDALDSAEYTGSVIILLNEGVGFVKRNMHTAWKKTPDSRIEMPDYCERSVFEGIVNALIHRDYLINGSEVHIDMFDDRLVIYSPGGMPDGSNIQDCDISDVPSTRRNPILADIFARLGYMERQGSGLGKILAAYETAANYQPECAPQFYSDRVKFTVTLPNLNFNTSESNFENKASDEALNKASNEALFNPEQLILEYFRAHPSATQKEALENLPFSRSKLQRIMHELMKKGFMERVGSKKTGKWIVHPLDSTH
jgi:ATP-dependent DNA helicase RecG